MIFVWGKRTYGAADKLGTVSVKTVFGHLWYLPLFPTTSFYVDAKSGNAFELNGLRWRSVLFAYLRVWGGICAFLTFLHARNVDQDAALPVYALSVAMAALVAASYLYDKKMQRDEVRQLRQSMEKHFGVALDPYECLVSLQQEINALAQQQSATPLDEDWYKRAIRDPFAGKPLLELALLRARCDQHDQPLQQEVFRRLGTPARPA